MICGCIVECAAAVALNARENVAVAIVATYASHRPALEKVLLHSDENTLAIIIKPRIVVDKFIAK